MVTLAAGKNKVSRLREDTVHLRAEVVPFTIWPAIIRYLHDSSEPCRYENPGLKPFEKSATSRAVFKHSCSSFDVSNWISLSMFMKMILSGNVLGEGLLSAGAVSVRILARGSDVASL